MKVEKLSRRTGKKPLVYQPTKLNPDSLKEIEKQVSKGKYTSTNAAINQAVDEKFLPLEKEKK
jgi:hypothetical protein